MTPDGFYPLMEIRFQPDLHYPVIVDPLTMSKSSD